MRPFLAAPHGRLGRGRAWPRPVRGTSGNCDINVGFMLDLQSQGKGERDAATYVYRHDEPCTSSIVKLLGKDGGRAVHVNK
jgi:hypothetical protein